MVANNVKIQNSNNVRLADTLEDTKSLNFVNPATGAIYIGGVFDKTIMTDVIPEIDRILMSASSLAPELKMLTFNINSVGGEVTQLSALLTTIDYARKQGFKIATYVLGDACSCASILAMYGDKGQRFIGRTSSHLIHHFTQGSLVSTPDEIERVYKSQKEMSGIIKKLYLQNTKISSKQYDDFMSCDCKRLYVEDCIKYGLADKII